MGGQKTSRRVQGGHRRAAAESREVLQEHPVAQALVFRHVARHPRAEIAGAGADKQSIDGGGHDRRPLASLGQGGSGQPGRGAFVGAIERLGVRRKRLLR
jgi:hypothetical protein